MKTVKILRRNLGSILAVIAVILITSCSGCIKLMDEHTEVATITDKTVKMYSTGEGKYESKYLIFTDKGVFENTDFIYKWKYNSSDIYGDLQVGKTYNFTVIGLRVPFLSAYPNILEYHEVN